jgi:hypothetical protein
MNALEAASLVMIPSGYENGTLGSLKPTDGTGDFTFSRGSDISATRVNEDGYIEKGYENLLLQSNTFDTAWSTNNSTITAGQTGYDGSSDAWLLEAISAGSYRLVSQVPNNSGVYTFSCYAKQGTTEWIMLRINSNTRASFNLATGSLGTFHSSVIDSTIVPAGGGWYRITLTSADPIAFCSINLSNADYSYQSDAGDNIYIQDAMLNQGLVAYPYVETTTAPVAGGILEDMPRLDYSGSCPALLLEPQRTNLITHSEYFGAWSIIGTPTRTPNATTSPEGLENAYALSNTSGSAVRLRGANITSQANEKYVMSIFAKTNGTSTFGVRHQTLEKYFIKIDLSNQSYTSSGTWVDDVDFEDYGNGWWRVIFYFTADDTITGTQEIYLDDGESVYVYGWQIEQDATYPTSYIPTYGTSQTRLKDIVIGAGDVNTFNSTEGVLYAEFNAFADDRGESGFFQISDGTGNNRFLIGNSSAIDSKIGSVCVIGGALQWNINSSSNFDVTQFHKVALSYKENDITLYVDGQIQGTDTSAIMAPANTFNVLDFRAGLTTNRYGEVKQVLYFPTALSDDECIELTTI